MGLFCKRAPSACSLGALGVFKLHIIFGAVLGAIFGSFANVLIWRLPQGELPWSPAHSYCPHCRQKIPHFDNIPLISFILLRRRARCCGGMIDSRYFWVELTSMMMAALAALRHPPHDWGSWVMLGSICFFQSVLLAIAVIDWKTYTIPDLLSLGSCLLMILVSPFNEFLGLTVLNRVLGSLIGAISAAAIYGFFAAAGKKIYKVEAMGGGDVKLAAAIGSVLGWRGLVALVSISSALGLIYAAPLLMLGRLGRRDPIPYGPFMALAAVLLLWTGPDALGRLISAISH